MSHEGQIIRSTAKVTPILEKDWRSRVGLWFRFVLKRMSYINRRFLQIDHKAAETPNLLWKAAQGYLTEKHAKAFSDYSKGESDRIEIELKRRTLESKTVQEEAEAEKRKIEVRLARLAEIKARIELAKELQSIGVAIDVVSEELHIYKISEQAPSIDVAATLLDEGREYLY